MHERSAHTATLRSELPDTRAMPAAAAALLKPRGCAASTSPPAAQAKFATGPETPRQARAFVRELLGEADPPLDDDRADDVDLVVSELVTNAVRYGTEPGDSLLVVVLLDLAHVRVEVHDPVRRRPRRRDAASVGVRGRGLYIVDALTARWGVLDRPFGKVVWAQVPR